MSKLTSAQIIGGNSSIGRNDRDYYATPSNVVVALLDFLSPDIEEGAIIWEPAAGTGEMAEAIKGCGYGVVCSDAHDYGLGHEVKNFYDFKDPLAPHMITNPPFMLAEMFIKKALQLELHMFCLLLKSTYWHAASRRDLFNSQRPTYILPLTWRPDFRGLGAPTMDLCWNVWHSYSGTSEYIPLPKPSK